MSRVEKQVTSEGLTAIARLKKEREALVEQLVKSPTWAAGSYRETIQYNKGYPDVGHSHQFISRRFKGRYKSTYVRKSQIESAKRAVEWRRRVDAIVTEIAEINIEIIKLGGQP